MSKLITRRALLAAAPALVICKPAILRAHTPFSGSLLFNGAGSAVCGGTGTDPFFSSVTLLCHMDGNDMDTNCVDSSLSNHTVTATNGAAISTAEKQFCRSSLDTNGLNGFASTADSNDWAFGAGEFTLEVWVRRVATMSALHAIAAQYSDGSNTGFFWGMSFGDLRFYYSTTGSDLLSVGAAYTLPLNTWTFLKVKRDSANLLSVLAAGSTVASATVSATFFNSTRPLRLMNDASSLSTFLGQTQEYRITKGVGRVDDTVPIAAFPNQ